MLSTLERVATRWRLVEYRPTRELIVDWLEKPCFEIAVFERVSSGKPSLLNHIAGSSVLPVGVTPVTAALPGMVAHEVKIWPTSPGAWKSDAPGIRAVGEALAVVGVSAPTKEVFDPLSRRLVKEGRAYRPLRSSEAEEAKLFQIDVAQIVARRPC